MCALTLRCAFFHKVFQTHNVEILSDLLYVILKHADFGMNYWLGRFATC